MRETGMSIVWLITSLIFAPELSASAAAAASQEQEDAVHVRLYNGTHGVTSLGEQEHAVAARLLHHNESHSVLHLNSSSAGLHEDLLVSDAVVAAMQLSTDPVNGSHVGHGSWQGDRQLVAADEGWVASPLNSTISAADREAEMAVADSAHLGTTRLFAAIVGGAAGVMLIAGVGFYALRSRRQGDAALLAEEDEEFTVFSVVDHPYPGKKGDNYTPLP